MLFVNAFPSYSPPPPPHPLTGLHSGSGFANRRRSLTEIIAFSNHHAGERRFFLDVAPSELFLQLIARLAKRLRRLRQLPQRLSHPTKQIQIHPVPVRHPAHPAPRRRRRRARSRARSPRSPRSPRSQRSQRRLQRRPRKMKRRSQRNWRLPLRKQKIRKQRRS